MATGEDDIWFSTAIIPLAETGLRICVAVVASVAVGVGVEVEVEVGVVLFSMVTSTARLTVSGLHVWLIEYMIHSAYATPPLDVSIS